MFRSLRRLVAAATSALAIAAGALASAPSAQAALPNRDTCASTSLTQPFIAWHDFSWYELAPGGTFSDASWSLSGGAQIVSGAEPFDAAGTLSSSSLSLVPGASAQSPATCIAATYRDARYFLGGTGVVAVSVVADGVATPAGVASALGSWGPSPPVRIPPAIAGALDAGTVQVSLRFTALEGAPLVSDVFIDPCRRW